MSKIFFFILFLSIIIQAYTYSREDGVAYARAHVHNINHQCGNYISCTPCSYWGSEHCGYAGAGGDCANFVSQCLEAGGLERDDTWYPDSYAWIRVVNLRNYLVDTLGYRIINNASPDDLSVGDVLVYGDNHVAIVVRADSGALEVAQHTSDRLYSTTTSSWWTRKRVMLCGGADQGGFSSCSVIKMNG